MAKRATAMALGLVAAVAACKGTSETGAGSGSAAPVGGVRPPVSGSGGGGPGEGSGTPSDASVRADLAQLPPPPQDAGLGLRPIDLPDLPTKLVEPTIRGGLETSVVRRTMRLATPKITYCYERQLLARPGVGGTVTVGFVIGLDGKPGQVEATGVDAEVAACVASVVRTLKFPRPTGGIVHVRYPIQFRRDPG